MDLSPCGTFSFHDSLSLSLFHWHILCLLHLELEFNGSSSSSQHVSERDHVEQRTLSQLMGNVRHRDRSGSRAIIIIMVRRSNGAVRAAA